MVKLEDFVSEVGHKLEVGVLFVEGWVESDVEMNERQNWPCFTFPCVLLFTKMLLPHI